MMSKTKQKASHASPIRSWSMLAFVCVVQFVLVLSVNIVNIALPSIQQSLGFSQENLQWVLSSYVLTFGCFLILAGRAADLFGRRQLFMVGLVFIVAFCVIESRVANPLVPFRLFRNRALTMGNLVTLFLIAA